MQFARKYDDGSGLTASYAPKVDKHIAIAFANKHDSNESRGALKRSRRWRPVKAYDANVRWSR